MSFTLLPAQLLADRFRVVRFCGRGGMGEVFEVEDLELGIPVALKILRPDLAVEADVVARFRREILLARKVTHPNVCRIFDVFHHRAEPSGNAPGGELVFLTMELLRGETLAERLRRLGRLSVEEARPLAQQMAEALGAAHAAGIVHRDFKSANVLLVENGGGPPRAVVTDFGLARSLAGEDPSGVSGSGRMIGTSAYMAPEQVEGRELTAAADIYALGVVLYEMVCGVRPFVGATALEVALKRLNEPPLPPRTHVPDLDPRWEEVILRCLDRDPSRRFAAAEDVLKAVGDGAARTAARELPTPRRRRLVLEAAFALAAAATVGLFAAISAPPEMKVEAAPASAPMQMRRSVAVLGFKNLSGRPDAAWMSTAFAEMLGSELAASEKLRTIPGENVARMRSDLTLADADSLAKDTLSMVRAHLGSDLVVLGSYLALGKDTGGRVRLDLRIQDAAAGETVAALFEVGTEAELLDLVSRTGAQLRKELGVEGSSSAGGAAEVLPASAEALRLYSEGLRRLRELDALGARDLLERAVAVDPSYALAHAALAEVWATLGHDRRAEEAAKRAFDLSSALPRQERLWIEGRYREAAHQHEPAIRLYRSLLSFFPDNLEYGLRLAAAETAAGKLDEALVTVAALRRFPVPVASDPRIDLAEAEVAVARSDFRRVQSLAAKAAEKGRDHGRRFLVARARAREGWALQNLGEGAAAEAAFEEARSLSMAVGDPAGAAWATRDIGLLRWYQGEVKAAKKMYEEALAVFREVGSGRGSAATLSPMAVAAWRQGDVAEAERLWNESLALYTDIGDLGSRARVLHNLALLVRERGELRRALAMYQDVVALFRQVGEQQAVPRSLASIGDILRDQGQLDAAEKAYAEALAISRRIGQKSDIARGLYALGELRFARGDLAEARRMNEEALAILNELGREQFAPEVRLALARIALEEDRLADVEAVAQQAAEAFAAKKVPDSEALARAVLAEALMRQRRPEAGTTMDRAVALAGGSQNRSVRLSVAIASARLAGASGAATDANRARARLNDVLTETRKAGMLGLQLEARLALAEIERSSGRADSVRRLQALEKEASSRGFGRIARRAALARNAPGS